MYRMDPQGNCLFGILVGDATPVQRTVGAAAGLLLGCSTAASTCSWPPNSVGVQPEPQVQSGYLVAILLAHRIDLHAVLIRVSVTVRHAPNYEIDVDFGLADPDHAACDRGLGLQARDSLRELERATVDAQFNQRPPVRRSVGSGKLDLGVLKTRDPAQGLLATVFDFFRHGVLSPTSEHAIRCAGFQ
jgi:hypothetical protein